MVALFGQRPGVRNRRDDERCQRISPQATPSYRLDYFTMHTPRKQVIFSLLSSIGAFLSNHTMQEIFICIFFSCVIFGKIEETARKHPQRRKYR